MQVSLPALKAFESAARLGSFKAAAAELSITPTAVSQHISNLEHRLNTHLFHREVRKVTLTQTGEYLSDNTSKGFKIIFDAIEQLSQSHTHTHIRITTTSSLAALRLIPALHEFNNAQPHISLELSTGEILDNQLQNLPIRLGDSRQVDKSDVIIEEKFNVFAAHTFANMTCDDSQMPLYTHHWKNNKLPAPPFMQWLDINSLKVERFKIESFDQELFAIQQAIANNGLVFCSTTLVQPFIQAGLLKCFNSHAIESQLCYYIPRKSRFETNTQKTVIEWLECLLS